MLFQIWLLPVSDLPHTKSLFSWLIYSTSLQLVPMSYNFPYLSSEKQKDTIELNNSMASSITTLFWLSRVSLQYASATYYNPFAAQYQFVFVTHLHRHYPIRIQDAPLILWSIQQLLYLSHQCHLPQYQGPQTCFLWPWRPHSIHPTSCRLLDV